jgi:hypothetical protein
MNGCEGAHSGSYGRVFANQLGGQGPHEATYPYLGPILQNYTTAENFSDKFSSFNFGPMSTQTQIIFGFKVRLSHTGS